MNAKNLVPKGLILLSTLYAMVRMWHWTIGFTFFTQLSNLFAALAVGLQLAELIRRRRDGSTAAIKFAATVSIFVTFLVYLSVLGPMTPGGLLAAYRQDGWASLCLHLITPLLTVADFCLNDAQWPWRFRHALWAMLPPVLYFLFILLLGALGVRWYQGMTAPYPFLNYAAPCGWFGYMPETASATTLGVGVFYVMLALLALFLLTGSLLLAISRKLRRVKR